MFQSRLSFAAISSRPAIPSLKKARYLCLGFSALLLWPLEAATHGMIAFSGVLRTQACVVSASGAASGTGDSIVLNFESVPISELQPPGTWLPAYGKNFTLLITCPGAYAHTLVRTTFMAGGGSGLDPDAPSLLKLDDMSTASGVGIALWDPRAAVPLDLSTNPVLNGLFSVIGDQHIAIINVAAIYSRTAAAPAKGTASAALPFMLSYE